VSLYLEEGQHTCRIVVYGTPPPSLARPFCKPLSPTFFGNETTTVSSADELILSSHEALLVLEKDEKITLAKPFHQGFLLYSSSIVFLFVFSFSLLFCDRHWNSSNGLFRSRGYVWFFLSQTPSSRVHGLFEKPRV
jgi:hypothetical protein